MTFSESISYFRSRGCTVEVRNDQAIARKTANNGYVQFADWSELYDVRGRSDGGWGCTRSAAAAYRRAFTSRAIPIGRD